MHKLYVGVDLHKRQFTVFFMRETGKGTFFEYPTTNVGYQSFLGALDKTRKELTEDIVIGVESTGNTRYFKNQMEKSGFVVKVVNTMKFKIVNESANKTDRHDAKTIAEFLSKDMLPEATMKSETSEQLSRLLTSRDILVKTNVRLKNQIHGIMLGYGIDTKNGQLNTIKGRAKAVDFVDDENTKKIISLLITSIESNLENIETIEDTLKAMTCGDKVVELLQTIPGTGFITALTVRSQIDNIARFKSYEKLSSYAGLVPWVQCSDKTMHYGKITKRGPQVLRTALIQMVLGMVRCKKETSNRYMNSYRNLKKKKGSGKALVAIARRFTKLIWTMLMDGQEYDPQKASVIYKIVDRQLLNDDVEPIEASA